MNYRFPQDNITLRIRWLMLVRAVIVTFMLGIATLSDFMGVNLLPERSLSSYYIIIIVTYGFSFFYLFLLYRSNNITVNVYIQAAGDVLLITYLVYVTGGTSSIYSVFYTLAIIYAVLFLGRRGGLIIASACSIFYGALLDLEYFGIIDPLYAAIEYFPFRASYVFSRMFTHILSFYLIAFLTSFVVEQERKVRTLLAEKEDAFEQLDMLHRSIVESVNLGILTINLSGKIKSFNMAAKDITGYSFADVEGRGVEEIFPSCAHMMPKGDAQRMPAQNRFEMSFKTKNDQEAVLGCSVSPLNNNRGERIGDIMIFQDLTSIKKMEENYEKSRRMAFIGEMAARLAHEIRNPLASISGSIQVLKRDLRLSEGDERLMRIIMRGKEQIEVFMKEFLLLARPMPGAHEMVNIKEITEDVLAALKYVPDWREGIEVRASLAENILIYANRSEVRQILWNLLLNALQAMPGKGVLTVETEKKSFRDFPDAVEILVADTGCGIVQNDMAKIFDPFYTTRERGTGLGLAIVNRIVESKGGKIKISSEIGKGTRCVILLPIAS